MEVLLYFGLPTKNEHDDFSRPQKFIAYPQPHEILKCLKTLSSYFFIQNETEKASKKELGKARFNEHIKTLPIYG